MDSESIFLKPTFYALLITGIAILLILTLIVLNYKKIIKAQTITLILMIALLGNLIANHGNLHYVLERDYDYNPLKLIYEYFNT